MFMGKSNRHVVVEYQFDEYYDPKHSKIYKKFNPTRLTQWKWVGGILTPFQTNCPYESAYSIKGYFNTLGIPVSFYDNFTRKMSVNLPML